MGFLSGGSKSKSESGNKFAGWGMDTFGGPAAQFGGSTNALGNILGLGGSGAHDGAMQDYWDSSGGKFLMGQGLDQLDGKFSAMGLGRSGSAMKAMEGFRQDLASTKLDNYLSRLSELAKLQLGAGGLVIDAGQYSKGNSSAKEGLGGLIGSALSAAAMASDRRLKTKIELIRRDPDGLGWYRFAYKSEPDTMLEGVMADEVKELRPAAYVPNFRGDGYDGVNYAALAA